jgi:hypothetical protein
MEVSYLRPGLVSEYLPISTLIIRYYVDIKRQFWGQKVSDKRIVRQTPQRGGVRFLLLGGRYFKNRRENE